jgi:predicted transcriptional regulator
VHIELEERIARVLERIAEQQQRDLRDIVHEAVEQYITRQAQAEDFDTAIKRIMGEHAWLLDELAKH